MPFVKDETEEAKKRILQAAEQQFSQKGFDATRVDHIAKEAGVNKALIYYYFQSKEDILNHLIDTLFDDVAAIAMEFVKGSVVPMIEKGKLDIQQDRWCFASGAEAETFNRTITRYYERMIDYALSHRQIVRILIFESLKNGTHHDALFRLQDLISSGREDSPYQTIRKADRDLAYSVDDLVFRFFFGITPIFHFAAYFDDYAASSGLDAAELRASFLRAYQKMSLSFFHG